jgi:hypothetical protein
MAPLIGRAAPARRAGRGGWPPEEAIAATLGGPFRPFGHFLPIPKGSEEFEPFSRLILFLPLPMAPYWRKPFKPFRTLQTTRLLGRVAPLWLDIPPPTHAGYRSWIPGYTTRPVQRHRAFV